MKTVIDPSIQIVEMSEYPEDYMDIMYDAGSMQVFQVVYVCPYGYFTRMAKEWRAFLPDDTSLEGLEAIHVRAEDRKAVRDLFDEAQMGGKVLQYRDVEKYAIYYSFELEEDSQ